MLAFLSWWLLSGFATSAPIVHDGGCNVTYLGVYESEIETFLAIPYGQDTGHQNRFKASKAFIPRPGSTIDATAAGPACPQQLGAQLLPIYLGNITEISEDCLHLNIYRPNGTKAGDKLPVLLHIHGGSFIAASKDEPIIQPSGLILESIANGHTVMAVNINYRLGVFGFAKSDAVISGGGGNAGLLDQRLALEWVQDHIEAFGGDPEKITIYGQSSGGLAVGLQMMGYGASKPAPFHQAICESQALEPGITGNFTDHAMQRLVNAIDCNSTDIQSEATLTCLRSLSTEELVNAQTNTHGEGPGDNIGDEWLPYVDGTFLPAAPSELINEGRFHDVPAIIGWCEDDTNLFVDHSIKTDNDTFSFFAAYLPAMPAKNVQKLLSLYPVSDFQANPSANLSAQFYRSGRILRDLLMTCQPIFYARGIADAGGEVYLYDQNQTILTPILDSPIVDLPGLGIIHTSEMAYVFGNLSHYNVDGFPYEPNATDFALARRASRTWSTFATLGRPSLRGHETLKGWTPAFTRKNETDIFVIGGQREGLSAEDGPRSNPALEAQKLRQRCGFINSPEIIKQMQY